MTDRVELVCSLIGLLAGSGTEQGLSTLSFNLTFFFISKGIGFI